MGVLSDRAKEMMRDEAEILMRDKGQFRDPDDNNGGPEPGPDYGEWSNEVSVGFQWLSPDDVTKEGGGQAAPTNEAVIRVSLDRTISENTRFRLTKRFGEKLDPAPEFRVVGEPRRGLVAQRASLRRVTGGSVG